MTATLTLYTHPQSRGRMARWMLEETGLPYDAVVLDYHTSMKAAEYLAINPMGKVPALRHGDTVITENAAIALYLADLVPEKKLAPPVGSPARGSYYRWVLFAAAPLEAMLTAQAEGHLADPFTSGYGKPQDIIGTLRKAVSGKTYLAGEGFTMADLYMAGVLGYYLRTGELEALPEFSAFVAQHSQRAALAVASEKDNALMAGHPQPAQV